MSLQPWSPSNEHYDISPDGQYNSATGHAVMAFQKVNGLGRDGVAGAATLAKLSSPVTPGPLVAGGGSTRVEVDVARWVRLQRAKGQYRQ